MNIFAWVGVTIALIISVAVLFGCAAWFISEWKEDRYSRKVFVKAAMCRELGGEIWDLSHWFSENREAMYAIKALARCMMKRGDIQYNLIREEWRADIRTDKV